MLEPVPTARVSYHRTNARRRGRLLPRWRAPPPLRGPHAGRAPRAHWRAGDSTRAPRRPTPRAHALPSGHLLAGTRQTIAQAEAPKVGRAHLEQERECPAWGDEIVRRGAEVAEHAAADAADAEPGCVVVVTMVVV